MNECVCVGCAFVHGHAHTLTFSQMYSCTTDVLFNEIQLIEQMTTFSNGSLGSRNDEERSEMRYVV
jgi:hypothetical protein